jgi:phage terminase small subunit
LATVFPEIKEKFEGGGMNPREEAKKLYLQGEKSLKEIAEELSISYDSIRQWKVRDKWGKKSVTKKCHKKSKSGTSKKAVNEAIKDIPELNYKQQLFCLYYVKNKNASLAAIKAGYSYNSASQIGYQLLQNPSVRAEIERLKYLKKQAIMLSEDDIVEKYMEIAFADITDFVDFGTTCTGGIDQDFFKFNDARQIDGGLIREIKNNRQGMSIKLEDRQRALKWLADYYEMNPEANHHKDYDNKKQRLDRERFELEKKKSEKEDW